MDTWIERTAYEVGEMPNGPTSDMVKCLLEAAGEIKCVALKVMLARCYECALVGAEMKQEDLEKIKKLLE